MRHAVQAHAFILNAQEHGVETTDAWTPEHDAWTHSLNTTPGPTTRRLEIKPDGRTYLLT